MHMFSKAEHLDFYLNQVDQSCYLNMREDTESFYWKYEGLGYKNKQATYWHHDEIPHRLFADELHRFINK